MALFLSGREFLCIDISCVFPLIVSALSLSSFCSLEDGMHSWMRKSLPDYCGIMGGNDLLSHDSEGFRDEIVHGSLPAIIDYTLQLAGKRKKQAVLLF